MMPLAFAAKVVAATSFTALLVFGGSLYHRLGKRAEAEEAEALLEAEFARIGEEYPEIVEELRRIDENEKQRDSPAEAP